MVIQYTDTILFLKLTSPNFNYTCGFYMWFFHVQNEKIYLKVDRSGQLYLPKQNYCYK